MQQDDRFEEAKRAAQARFNVGKDEQRRLLERVMNEIPKDRYVSPANMGFALGENDSLVHRYASGEDVTLHPHALRQICESAPMPIQYAKYLNSADKWKVELLAYNLNTLFHNNAYLSRNKRPMKFLHRRVGTQLRGFLSNSFNRHLVSASLLGPFVEACSRQEALPVEAVASDLRASLKCYLPMPFQVVEGKFVCLGAQWSNSDFGVGRLTVAQTVWDPLRGTRAILDETFSKVHLGPVVEGDSELELPDEVNRTIVQAQGAAIQASVEMMLSPDSVARVLHGLRIAHEQEISWKDLKGRLGKLLSEKELQSIEKVLRGEDEGELPPPGTGIDGKPFFSHWWASEVLSTMADRAGDAERKLDLQQAAGRVLTAAQFGIM